MARLQSETAPENYLNRSEKWSENSKKDPQNDPKNVKPFSCRLNISHRHFSNSFSPPKVCTKKLFFTVRPCRGSHAKSNSSTALRFEIDMLECSCSQLLPETQSALLLRKADERLCSFGHLPVGGDRSLFVPFVCAAHSRAEIKMNWWLTHSATVSTSSRDSERV